MVLRTYDDLDAPMKEEATELPEDVCEENYELLSLIFIRLFR